MGGVWAKVVVSARDKQKMAEAICRVKLALIDMEWTAKYRCGRARNGLLIVAAEGAAELGLRRRSRLLLHGDFVPARIPTSG